MKNIIIILDPAHGANVSGKCSPDGRHREYKWSRNRVNSLKLRLINLGYEVYVTTESENEPGLSKRKNFANQIKKGKKKLLISLHNDAKGSGSEWCDARGFSIFTTKGVTNSDICADFILEQLKKDFGNLKVRQYTNSYLNKDFEENFTVLMGSDYMAVLIEWLFQDNKEDVSLLLDPDVNFKFEESLVKAIERINNYFGK